MSDLRGLWEQYKRLELSQHVRNDKVLAVEVLIHAEQKKIGTDAYDFDNRWTKKEERAKSTVEGPPDLDSKPPEKEYIVPQTKFTLEQAQGIVGENELAILEDCAKKSEARMICLASIFDKLNPVENKNVARRGQGINMSIAEFHKRKEE